jgi:iron complex transport system substrate-binding protein
MNEPRHKPTQDAGYAGVVALTLTMLVACGGGTIEESVTTTIVTDTTAGGDPAFPVTITHAYGETTVEAPPQRVFSISYRHQDLLYELGVAPIGVREWWGEYDYATWPWGEEARTAVGAEPAVMTGDLNLELIAAHEPDLIIAIYSGITEEEYDLLSEIAPVVGRPVDYEEFGTPWREEVRTIGRVVGKTEEAEEIIAEVEDQIAAARSAHPEFEGAAIALADYAEGVFTTYGSSDMSHQFLIELGFVIPEVFDELAPGAFTRVDLGDERVDLLDLDVVIWYAYARAEIEAHPVVQTLDLTAEGRSVWLEDPVLEAAFSFQTPLAMRYTLENLVPQLALAIDGDPATTIDS